MVITIKVESMDLSHKLSNSGGIYYQPHIHNDSQPCVIYEKTLITSHIYVSYGNVFPNKKVPCWFSSKKCTGKRPLNLINEYVNGFIWYQWTSFANRTLHVSQYPTIYKIQKRNVHIFVLNGIVGHRIRALYDFLDLFTYH